MTRSDPSYIFPLFTALLVEGTKKRPSPPPPDVEGSIRHAKHTHQTTIGRGDPPQKNIFVICSPDLYCHEPPRQYAQQGIERRGEKHSSECFVISQNPWQVSSGGGEKEIQQTFVTFLPLFFFLVEFHALLPSLLPPSVSFLTFPSLNGVSPFPTLKPFM